MVVARYPIGDGFRVMSFFGVDVHFFSMPDLLFRDMFGERYSKKLNPKACEPFRDLARVKSSPGNVDFGILGAKLSVTGFCMAHDASCASANGRTANENQLLALIHHVSEQLSLPYSLACGSLQFAYEHANAPPVAASVVIYAKDVQLWVAALNLLTKATTYVIDCEVHISNSGILFRIRYSKVSPVTVVVWGNDGTFELPIAPKHKTEPEDTSRRIATIINAGSWLNVSDTTSQFPAMAAAMCKTCSECQAPKRFTRMEGVILNAATQLCLEVAHNWTIYLDKCSYDVGLINHKTAPHVIDLLQSDVMQHIRVQHDNALEHKFGVFYVDKNYSLALPFGIDEWHLKHR